MAYANGVVSVGTAATLICTPGPGGAWIQNRGTAVVYIGGADVTADAAATGGIALGTAAAPGPTPVLVGSGTRPGTLTADDALYGRVAAGTTSVAFLGVV